MNKQAEKLITGYGSNKQTDQSNCPCNKSPDGTMYQQLCTQETCPQDNVFARSPLIFLSFYLCQARNNNINDEKTKMLLILKRAKINTCRTFEHLNIF